MFTQCKSNWPRLVFGTGQVGGGGVSVAGELYRMSDSVRQRIEVGTRTFRNSAISAPASQACAVPVKISAQLRGSVHSIGALCRLL
jgi:hypothetical protein